MNVPAVATVGIMAVVCSALASQAGPPPEWSQPGTEWRVRVRQYGPTLPEGRSGSPIEVVLCGELEVRVTVLDLEEREGGRFARFSIQTPPGSQWGGREEPVILSVNVATGAVDADMEFDRYSAHEHCGQTWLLTSMIGYPVDWIVTLEDFQAPVADPVKLQSESAEVRYSKTVRNEVVAATSVVHVEASSNHQTKQHKSVRVVQTWVPGEPWWRTFKRYQGGHLMMEAEWVRPSSSAESSSAPAGNPNDPRRPLQHGGGFGSPSQDPPEAWRFPGTTWHIDVDYYRTVVSPLGVRKERLPPPRREKYCLAFDVVVGPIVQEGDPSIVEFLFRPAGEPIEFLKGLEQPLRVDVDTGLASWKQRREYRWPGHLLTPIAAQRPFVFGDLWGCPIDWVVSLNEIGLDADRVQRQGEWEAGATYIVRDIRDEVSQDGVAIRIIDVCRMWTDREDEILIRQTWVPGEPWWRTFERYRMGELELSAQRQRGASGRENRTGAASPGPEWTLMVRQYPSDFLLNTGRNIARGQRIPTEFQVLVTRLPRQSGEEWPISRFKLCADTDAPAYINTIGCILELNSETGALGASALTENGRKVSASMLPRWGEEQWLMLARLGYPVEWITTFREVEGAAQFGSDAVERRNEGLFKSIRAIDGEDGPVIEIRAGIGDPEAPPHLVVQTWVAGERWWRTFKRYQSGHLMLEAERVLARERPRASAGPGDGSAR